MANAKSKQKADALGPVAKGFKRIVRIRADKDGFRRAGMKHSRSATDHPIDKFDADQMEALQNEPKLFVQVLDVADEAAESKGNGAAAA